MGLIYTMGVLGLFEASARAALAFLAPSVLARPQEDASWRLRWVARHREGVAGHGFDVYHPTRGWALAGGLKEGMFGDKLLTTNSRGLRGDREYGYDRPSGLRRVLILGDSFTFGEEVSDYETYPFFLERMLPGREVLNLGVQGYGHDQMLLYFRDEGRRYHSDLVIVGFVGQDMERNLLAFRDFAKPRFELRNGALILHNTPVPTPEEVLAHSARGLRLLDFLEILEERIRAKTSARPSTSRSLTAALLDELRQEVISSGGALLLAYLPVGGEIDTPDLLTEGTAFFSEYCSRRPSECLDLRPAFLSEARRGLRLKTLGHWDRREHHIAARVLADWLRDRDHSEGRLSATGPQPQ